MTRPGLIERGEMPGWLRGGPLEGSARRLGRALKRAARSIERVVRRGRARVRLPSVDESIWLDFDFAVTNPLPREDPLLQALLHEVRPGGTVFDVGAFVGCYAVAAARRVGDGRVYAFEPVAESARLLERHCLLNGAQRRVRLVQAACGREEGTAEMTVWPTRDTTLGSGNALRNVYPHADLRPSLQSVPVLRLDAFVRREGRVPDLLKIDVEGAELWVLEGARGILESRRPPVFLEIHAFAWHLFETDESAVRAFLRDVRYEMLELKPPHPPLRTIPDYGHAVLRPIV